MKPKVAREQIEAKTERPLQALLLFFLKCFKNVALKNVGQIL